MILWINWIKSWSQTFICRTYFLILLFTNTIVCYAKDQLFQAKVLNYFFVLIYLFHFTGTAIINSGPTYKSTMYVRWQCKIFLATHTLTVYERLLRVKQTSTRCSMKLHCDINQHVQLHKGAIISHRCKHTSNSNSGS